MDPEKARMSGIQEAACREVACRHKFIGVIRHNLLVIITVVGVGIGFAGGFAMQTIRPSDTALLWIGMPGELYIRLLKLMILPLVICSVITGTARMDPKSDGKVSIVCLVYVMVTNCLGAVIGAAICLIVKPGVGVQVDEGLVMEQEVMDTSDIFADLLRNIIPDNLVAACFQKAQTMYEFETSLVLSSGNGTDNVTEAVREMTQKYVGAVNSANILGLIIVCSAFGVTAASMGKEGEVFLSFFRSTTEIILKILRVIVWCTPVGVASLITKSIASTSDVETEFRKLAYYFMSVMIALFAWGFIVLPLLVLIVRRGNPFKFLWSIVSPMMIVFATGSTLICLPETFYSLEQKNNVDVRISRFVAPLAATIGRSGCAIYICASCIFIMQTLGRDTSTAEIILVILLTWTSSIAIPSVAGASLVTVLILLTALNIPGEAAAMLFTLEFFLDRSRSMVNLVDQIVCALITDKLCHSSNITEKPDSSANMWQSMTTTVSNGKLKDELIINDAIATVQEGDKGICNDVDISTEQV